MTHFETTSLQQASLHPVAERTIAAFVVGGTALVQRESGTPPLPLIYKIDQLQPNGCLFEHSCHQMLALT